MNNWAVQLAKLLKERDNPPPLGAVKGRVIRGLPNLRVSLDDESVLDEELIIGHRIYSLASSLQAGDELILIPSSDRQTFMVIDKVGE